MKKRIQNEGARKLLKLLRSARQQDRVLTYTSAAIALGRPKGHARAVAQMCDLLDAAAAYARVPLLALVTVRQISGDINPKAWSREASTGNKDPKALKRKIVECAKAHEYTERDFSAIEAALDALDGLGNRKAWERVRREVSNAELFAAIAAEPINFNRDAINDLGTDTPGKRQVKGVNYARDANVRNAVLRRAKGACEYCEKRSFLKDDGSHYLETHHIIALAREGADRPSNVIALCADHHKEAHFGKRRIALEKKMIGIARERAN